MDQIELLRRFDELYEKTIPLILFSNLEDSKRFNDLLSSLFISYYKPNRTTFNEAYENLQEMITERKIYDRHKEELIAAFRSTYLSYNDRLNIMNKELSSLKKLERRIINVESSRSYFKKWLKELEDAIISFKSESGTIIRKNKQENFGKNKLANIQDKNDKRCPVESCEGVLGAHGIRHGIKRVQCKKCKKGFPKKNDNEFYHCKSCGGVLSGWGEVVKCIDCGEKNRIAGKPKKGKYKLKCPYCNYVWWYNGSRGLNSKITCPDVACHRHFSLKNKHILKDNTGDENVQNNS